MVVKLSYNCVSNSVLQAIITPSEINWLNVFQVCISSKVQKENINKSLEFVC